MEEIKLAIIEDDAVIKESLEIFMVEHPTIEITASVTSVEAFLELAQSVDKPEANVLLLDIGLPGMTGIQGIYHIRKNYPNLILRFSGEDAFRTDEDQLFRGCSELYQRAECRGLGHRLRLQWPRQRHRRGSVRGPE